MKHALLAVVSLLLGVLPASAETAWFIVPYDTQIDQPGRVVLVCGVARYLPTLPRPDKSDWSCIDIRKGYAVAKVAAPAKVLETLRADPDFHDITGGTIDAATLTLLTSLGYTAVEVTGTKQSILITITASRSQIIGVTNGVVIYGEPTASGATPSKLDDQIKDVAP